MSHPDGFRSGAEPLPGDPWGEIRSKIIRHLGQFCWEGIPRGTYKTGSRQAWKGISRTELAGRRGEATQFHVRYFEIEPGGHSSLERHDHSHVVIILRGEGEARLAGSGHLVRFGDVVYIAPDEPHQFRNPGDATEPFGFLCLVNAERDPPKLLEPHDGSPGPG
ncbi:MAG: cupin domain-containing protein [Planctomycetota bacterium]